jgi:hypothetical protein
LIAYIIERLRCPEPVDDDEVTSFSNGHGCTNLKKGRTRPGSSSSYTVENTVKTATTTRSRPSQRTRTSLTRTYHRRETTTLMRNDRVAPRVLRQISVETEAILPWRCSSVVCLSLDRDSSRKITWASIRLQPFRLSCLSACSRGLNSPLKLWFQDLTVHCKDGGIGPLSLLLTQTSYPNSWES